MCVDWESNQQHHRRGMYSHGLLLPFPTYCCSVAVGTRPDLIRAVLFCANNKICEFKIELDYRLCLLHWMCVSIPMKLPLFSRKFKLIIIPSIYLWRVTAILLFGTFLNQPSTHPPTNCVHQQVTISIMFNWKDNGVHFEIHSRRET